MSKIPYMLVVGDKEQEDGTVAVRKRDTVETSTMPADEFIDMLCNEILTKGQNLN